MADAVKLYDEDQLNVLAADRAARETAELRTANDALKAENVALKTANDTLDAEKAALITERDAAVSEKAKFIEDAEKAAAIAAVKDVRVKAVADLTNPEFVTAERADRYAAMEQAAFDAFLVDLGAVKPVKAPGAPETAAFTGGVPAAPTGDAVPTSRAFLAAR